VGLPDVDFFDTGAPESVHVTLLRWVALTAKPIDPKLTPSRSTSAETLTPVVFVM
jgi:hypothetical protein